VRLAPAEYSLQLRPVDGKAARLLAGGKSLVVLDLDTDAELEAEGLARDLVRLVQQARRDAGLNVTDRVAVRLGVPRSVASAVSGWLDYVAAQVLASSIEIVATEDRLLTPQPPDDGAEDDLPPVSVHLERTPDTA
jgi:isoleucyl-tRNA synthetase